MPRPEICVIYNPTAGKNRGRRRLERIRQALGGRADFWPSQYSGHAVELAERAAREGIPLVAAAGGDGTAHEVLNGLMRVQNPSVQFTIFPIGSANDYAFSLGLHEKNVALTRRVDVGLARTPAGKEVFFGCCLGLGFNGRVTWEARRIRRLQGVFLYGLAAIRALVYHYQTPLVTLCLDDAPPWTTPTLLFSTLVGKREGGFVLAPHAEMDDGWLDFVHAADLSRWQVLRLLPQLALFGAARAEFPKVRQGRCRHLSLHSEVPLIVHADGEFICLPEERIYDLEIEILPGVLRVACGVLSS